MNQAVSDLSNLISEPTRIFSDPTKTSEETQRTTRSRGRTTGTNRCDPRTQPPHNATHKEKTRATGIAPRLTAAAGAADKNPRKTSANKPRRRRNSCLPDPNPPTNAERPTPSNLAGYCAEQAQHENPRYQARHDTQDRPEHANTHGTTPKQEAQRNPCATSNDERKRWRDRRCHISPIILSRSNVRGNSRGNWWGPANQPLFLPGFRYRAIFNWRPKRNVVAISKRNRDWLRFFRFLLGLSETYRGKGISLPTHFPLVLGSFPDDTCRPEFACQTTDRKTINPGGGQYRLFNSRDYFGTKVEKRKNSFTMFLCALASLTTKPSLQFELLIPKLIHQVFIQW